MKKTKQIKREGQKFAWSFVIVCFLLSGAVLLNMTTNKKMILNKNNNAILNKAEESKVSDKKLANYLEFSLYNLDIAKVNSYKMINQGYTIQGINKITYLDLNGDNKSEAIVEFDTDPYGKRDLFRELLSKVIRQANAGGLPTVTVFGIFNYDDISNKWSPLFMDFVAMPLSGCEESGLVSGTCSIDKKYLNDIPVMLRIEILNKEYGEKKELPNKTDILIEKKYCWPEDDGCSYELHFSDFDFTKEIIK